MNNLNELAQKCHSQNKQWWIDINTGELLKRNKFELLALAISEVSECLEGERKDLMDDKLPQFKMAVVEMADVKIRLFDFAAGFKINLINVVDSPEIPDNKGEALYNLTKYIVEVGKDLTYTGKFISLALNYIDAYCKKWGYPLEEAFNSKMNYNLNRLDHKHENRKLAGGKQF